MIVQIFIVDVQLVRGPICLARGLLILPFHITEQPSFHICCAISQLTH